MAVASHRTRRWTASRTSRSTSGAPRRVCTVLTSRASHVGGAGASARSPVGSVLCMQRTGRSGTDGEVKGGRFLRQKSRFTDVVTADGSSGFKAEPGRYHLYVARACPWSQRALIVHRLKGLADVIGISYANPYRDERGWAFEGDTFVDDLHGWDFLAEAYNASDADFKGRITVPVLWDRESGRIVNNDSADIVRMLNRAWDEWGDASVDLCPE